MKRSLLLTAALFAPLFIAGCDAAGPDTPPLAANARTGGAPTTDAGLAARPVSAARLDVASRAAVPSAPDAGGPSDTSPATASRGGAITYTVVENPHPPSDAPADASTVQVGGGFGDPQGIPPPPCDPVEPPDPNGNPPTETGDCGDPGGGGGGTPTDITNVRWFSRVTISGSTRANVVSSSEALNQYGQLKVIDYIYTTAQTTSNGTAIGGGATGGSNIAYAVVSGQIGRTTSGPVNLCQYGTHRFRVVSASTVYDQTDPSNDCEYWP